MRGYRPFFFIHSSVSGHLGSFHVSATINNASTNMGIQISFYDADFSSDKYPEIELLDQMAVLFFFFFCGTSILFSIVAVPISILPNSVPGLPFLHILSNSRGLVSF